MVNIKFIRENLKEVEKVLAKRRVKADLGHLIEIDDKRLNLIKEVDELRHERKKAAEIKDQGKGSEIKEKLSKLESSLTAVERELDDSLEQMPNMLSPQVPDGSGEKDNHEIKKWGKPQEFDFEPKDHLTLGKKLGIIDQEAAAKTSGHGFYYLMGDGALLEIALISWVISFLGKKGYKSVITPELVRKKFVEGTGYLPRREEPDIYKIEGENLYLCATAEIPLAGLHADQILNEEDLPANYVGFSTSFRRESGSY